MSSYDPDTALVGEEPISPVQFRESMRLVRLQIAVPISVMVSIGANLVCALAIKPGLPGINALNPTLVSPNAAMVGLYWALLYILQVGFCLTLLIVRKDATKETLVHGVGLRFAIANWLMAGWAVCFTLQIFILAEILLLINLVNVVSIHITLLYYPPTFKRPLDTLFIHVPMTMLLAMLFEVDWITNGFIALGWVSEDRRQWYRYTWQAVGAIAGVNVIAAIWEGIRRQYIMAVCSEYLLFTILFSSPRSQPTLPTTALPKPTALLVTLIIGLVLHPIAVLAGTAWKRTREREGRIRLEQEVEEAEEEERLAEAEARVEAHHAHAAHRAERA